MRQQQTNWRSSLARAVLCAAAVLATMVGSACKGLLDVKNPNNIAEDALNNSQAADQQANGVEASMTRMLSSVSVPYGVATDELDWIGSRDAWADLEKGAISNYLNEFTDGSFPYVGEARYLGDQTIARLEAFNSKNALPNKQSLARTYLYTAITYATIADMWDDFAFSNKTVPAPPVGRANMSKLYDTAISYLDKALPRSRRTGHASSREKPFGRRSLRRGRRQRTRWSMTLARTRMRVPRSLSRAAPTTNSDWPRTSKHNPESTSGSR